MLSWITILVSIDTSNENPNQDIESIFESGAAAQNYSFENIEVKDSVGAELAFKLTKQ